MWFAPADTWLPLYKSADIELNYNFSKCEEKPYLFVELKNITDKKVDANFEIEITSKSGEVLFTFKDWYVSVDPGTYSNKCGAIDDQQLAILLPEQFSNVQVKAVRIL